MSKLEGKLSFKLGPSDCSRPAATNIDTPSFLMSDVTLIGRSANAVFGNWHFFWSLALGLGPKVLEARVEVAVDISVKLRGPKSKSKSGVLQESSHP